MSSTDSATSPDRIRRLRGDETAVKVVIAGHLGAGKTTFVNALSDIDPLNTEETMTEASAGTDDLGHLPDKVQTTVAMDFGRVSLSEDVVLYLFGTPGQRRFWPLLEDLSTGAMGALILLDTRRLADSYPIIGLIEELGLPYAVAVNDFDGAPVHRPAQLREAMDLGPGTPLVACDARRRSSATDALITLTEYLLTLPENAR